MKNSDEAWSGKSRGGAFGHRFFVFLISRIGIRAAYAFLSLVVIYFIPFAPKATRAVWKYNRRILRYNVAQSAFKLYLHYYRFGQTIIDKIAILNGLGDRYSFEFDRYEELLQVLDRGPATVIGAHVGCWEIGSRFFGDYAERLNVVMYDADYRRIKEAVRGMETPYKIIPVNEGGLESLLKIKAAVNRGEYVCFQGDRYVSGQQTFEAEFMGHRALFPQGPFLISSKLKTPVIIYFALRERGMKYRFVFTVLEGGLSERDTFERYLKELSEVVEKYPQQWFNFYDVWH